MKRRKQSNRTLLERHRLELADINEKMAAMEARREELLALITEEENVEIIAAFREHKVNLEELPRILEGFRNNGEVPFSMNQSIDQKEEATNEAD